MPEYKTKRNDFLKEEYYEYTHESGLPVYVFPKKLSTSYALFATRYGSIDSRFRLAGDKGNTDLRLFSQEKAHKSKTFSCENPNYSVLPKEFTTVPDGIAHYLEHKMFENPNGEDTFERFARFGANANAYTSTNMTAYLFSCTSCFKENLEILLDFVTTPYFTPETVEKEQGIIAQEIRMYDDHPFRSMYQTLLESLYEKHNVRINVAGTVESISHITADILYECYRVFYNLSNMMLIVCGDVTVDEVNEVCDKVLKKQAPVDIIRDYPVEKADVYKPYAEKAMQVSKPLFGIGVKDIDIPSDGYERMKKYAEAEILNDVLFGKSGEFYNKLYEEGLLSSQFDVSWEINHSYSFNALFGESRDPKAVYDRFVSCVEGAKRNGISAEDFDRSKRALYASMVKCFDSTEDIANYFLNYKIDDGDLLDYVDVIKNVTIGDVTKLLNDAFRPEYYSMSVVNPLEVNK